MDGVTPKMDGLLGYFGSIFQTSKPPLHHCVKENPPWKIWKDDEHFARAATQPESRLGYHLYDFCDLCFIS